ncbi:hypothetical protein FNV43_RR07836 [Rhamnella rubrinervis]|uniref:F-box protein n=1 Tax=Rhamnella rubrinervis TaxID=2594499 RepID=A0A8K0HHB3_9ROSA|nr:hypothetical protein FNV43_RR07836 [Rhamnella rubrinervis]
MATLQDLSIFCVKGSSQLHRFKGYSIRATSNVHETQGNPLSLPSCQTGGLAEDLDTSNTGCATPITTQVRKHSYCKISTDCSSTKQCAKLSNQLMVAKLHVIMEAVADRVEKHNNIGAQRDNWNHLLLTSINAITLTAATMAGMAAISGAPVVALRLSSTILYLAATGMLVVINKIQPSQLAEEQRYAARLFKQLHGQIKSTLSLHQNLTIFTVNEAMEKALALDRAYPLPLLGKMLEKFPKIVEPALWWPKQSHERVDIEELGGRKVGNGWSRRLEEEMREIAGIIERKDVADYLRLSEKALKVNKFLAIFGPVLTGIGALGSALVGTSHGVWAIMLGVIAGGLASVVNTLEHGGQVGMVFEMYRSNAGFFRLMEETIESNLNEKDVERRENGEVFEMKVALQLGRSLSELQHLVDPSRNGVAPVEFASKLF